MQTQLSVFKYIFNGVFFLFLWMHILAICHQYCVWISSFNDRDSYMCTMYMHYFNIWYGFFFLCTDQFTFIENIQQNIGRKVPAEKKTWQARSMGGPGGQPPPLPNTHFSCGNIFFLNLHLKKMNYHGVGSPLGLEHVNNWSERKDINSEIEDIGTLRRYSHVSFDV